MIKNIAAIILGGVASIMTALTVIFGIKLADTQNRLDTTQESLIGAQAQLDAIQSSLSYSQNNNESTVNPQDIIRVVDGVVQISENNVWTDYCTLDEFKESDIVSAGIKKMENIIAENKKLSEGEKENTPLGTGLILPDTAPFLDSSTAVVTINNRSTTSAATTKPSENVQKPTQPETQPTTEPETIPQEETSEPVTEPTETEAPAPQPTEPEAPAPAPTEPETPAPQPTEPETPAPTKPTEPETPAPTKPETPTPAPTEPETEAPTSSGDGEDIGWTDDIL